LQKISRWGQRKREINILLSNAYANFHPSWVEGLTFLGLISSDLDGGNQGRDGNGQPAKKERIKNVHGTRN
jgi:hypothetical protein